MGKYIIYRDNQRLWRWTFYSSNGNIIGVSSESYHNKNDCLRAIEIMKGSGGAPVYER